MNMKEKIEADLVTAMKTKNMDVLTTLRAVKTAITVFEKSGNGEVDEKKIIDIFKKGVKQRQESIVMFERAGRDELAQREFSEIEILKSYLPQQISDDEVKTNVATAIEITGATTIRDMGKVMKEANKLIAGRADGSLVAQLVKEGLV